MADMKYLPLLAAALWLGQSALAQPAPVKLHWINPPAAGISTGVSWGVPWPQGTVAVNDIHFPA